jgi:nanoRNase/pAp phosphatase (c-di-AMP/oligoRNAs hydrolase)
VDLSSYGGIALVDHARPGVNDQLPPETDVDIVIDHHPPREPVEARFVDLRSDVGATSTLLVDYLQRLDIEPSTALATGLLFGIRVDTKEFSREIAVDDFEAAAYLVPFTDTETLELIEAPRMSAETFETIGKAIENRTLRDSVLTSCVGDFADRDAIAQAADRLLDMEGITTTLVYGVKDGTIYASGRARSTSTSFDVGETLRDAFEQIGDAGGHADMAGAQIPLGVLASDVENDELIDIVQTVIDERFFETLQNRLHWRTIHSNDTQTFSSYTEDEDEGDENVDDEVTDREAFNYD